MSVCVIIPFWNGSRWVERAIRSVVEQTISPAEFYVVNDGSRADERALLGELAQKYGFQILDQENGGQGSARNHGVAACQADWICFLDQDDFYVPEHIEILLKLVPANPHGFGFGYGSYNLADEAGKVFFENELLRSQSGLHPPRRDFLQMIGRNLSILPSASIISKDAFRQVGGFDCQFRGYEDDDLFSRIILAGLDCSYVPVPVYVWCQHKGSTTWSPTMAKSRFQYYRKVREFGAAQAKGFVDARALAKVLMTRFGRFFYKSAALAVAFRGDAQQLDLTLFRLYVTDLAVDDVPWPDRLLYRFRLWLLEHTRVLPLSLIWALKRFNRRRVDARRIRDGRQFLGD